MVFVKHNSLKPDIFFDSIFIPCFSGSRFFRIQVFQGPGFSGSGSRVQGPGPGFRSSPLEACFLLRAVLDLLWRGDNCFYKLFLIYKIKNTESLNNDYTNVIKFTKIRHITGRKQKRRKTKNSFPKKSVANPDLYKPVLNKIMTSYEQCMKYNFVAPLNSLNIRIEWRRSPNQLLEYIVRYWLLVTLVLISVIKISNLLRVNIKNPRRKVFNSNVFPDINFEKIIHVISQ